MKLTRELIRAARRAFEAGRLYFDRKGNLRVRAKSARKRARK